MAPKPQRPSSGLAVSAALSLLTLLLVFSFGCSKDDDGPTGPAGPGSEELTQSAWTHFETGDFDAALEGFDDAIGVDAAYGPAYVGQGWSRLALASASEHLQGALTSFDAAASRQQTGVEVKAGRACTLLALGEGAYENAAVEARAAQAAAGTGFTFAHRATFDTVDLILIEAFALAGKADLAGALEAADRIEASGIQATDPSTWVVGSILYPSFDDAILAFLTKLSNERAG
jgi:tetratricopeptide (TPR) repeat protein